MTSSVGTSRKWLAGVAAAGTVIALAGCAGGGAAGEGGDDVVRIAIVSDLTGSAATYHATALSGAQSVIEQVNADGGIDGRKIEVTGTYDTASSADTGGSATRSAINDEPDMILLMTGDVPTQSAVPLVQQAGIPALVALFPEDLADPAQPLWGFAAGDEQHAQFALSTAQNVLGDVDGAKIVWEYMTESPAAKAINDAAREAFEAAGAETVGTETVSYTATTFASQAAKVANLDPDMIVMSDGPATVKLVLSSLRTAGWDGAVVLAGDSANTPTEIASFADDNYYAYHSYSAPTDGSEMAKAAAAADQDSTVPYFSYGWSMAEVAVQAFGECGADCTAKSLIDVLNGLGDVTPEGDSTVGPLAFTPDNRIVVTTAQVLKWDSKASEVADAFDPLVAEPAGAK